MGSTNQSDDDTLRWYLNEIPAYVCKFDADFNLSFANSQYLTFFGLDAESYCGSSILSLVPEDQRETLIRRLRDVTPQSPNVRNEHEVIGVDGKLHRFEWFNRAVFSDDGSIRSYFASGHDVTDRTKAEDQLRGALEAAPGAVVMVNAKGTIIIANQLTENIFGYARHEIIDQPIEMLVPEEIREQHPVMRFNYLKDPRPRSMGAGRELFASRKDGSRFPVEIGLNPIVIDGELFVVSVIVDITDRKETLSALRESEARARHASQAKSEFLANMSHEIRTPLNGIVGMLELLAEEEISSDLQEKIAIARYSAGTLVRIIDDILDYSRIEAGMVEFQNELFPFRQTMKNVLASLRSKALEKELELSLFIDEAIPENLIGDQVRVSQIATNLIFNALKFTDEGHVHVFVKSKPVSPLQMQLLIEVQDTGIGIDEDRLEHIFEYFHQETMLTSQTYGGTGIGLTLSQELAQRMDGDITVESTKGKGSTFTASIILGLAENEAAQVAENIVPDHVVEYANSGCSGVEARVLLVEDDAVNQQVFLRFLAPYPVEVTVAENGEQAVEIFAKENFQVVLMDVRMPKMDGYDATRKIRQIERERKGKTPIIGLTAFAQERDRDRCMDAGMDMFLTKPIAKKAFLAALRSIIPYAISKDE